MGAWLEPRKKGLREVTRQGGQGPVATVPLAFTWECCGELPQAWSRTGPTLRIRKERLHPGSSQGAGAWPPALQSLLRTRALVLLGWGRIRGSLAGSSLQPEGPGGGSPAQRAPTCPHSKQGRAQGPGRQWVCGGRVLQEAPSPALDSPCPPPIGWAWALLLGPPHSWAGWQLGCRSQAPPWAAGDGQVGGPAWASVGGRQAQAVAVPLPSSAC